MLSITRTFAKLCIVPLASLAFLGVAPVLASNVVFTANPPIGSDTNSCSFASPCQTLGHAAEVVDPGGQVTCAQGTASGLNVAISSMTIDCPGVLVIGGNANAFVDGMIPESYVFRVRNLVINGQFGGLGGVLVTSGGTLIFENCVFENISSGPAITISPRTSPTTIILRNTRMVNNASGILLKPGFVAASINATLDHVTITNNNGGGIRADSSNGPITVDIIDSVIADNVSNGLNISSGTGTQNDMVSIARTTIAKNGLVGIQTGGSNAAVLLDTTLLDSNTNGATLASNGGHILSYGNNRIVGAPGSGFTGSLPLQ